MPRPPLRIPSQLEWWRREPGGAEWLDRLPRLVAECAELWSLHVGEPYEGGEVAWVAPAELPDGAPAVLKVNFPERESEREGDALAYWAGEGAVRLLAEDEGRRALLLERCEPGTQLWAEPDGEKTLRVAAGVLRTLWRPPPPGHRFRLLADLAAAWAEEIGTAARSIARSATRRSRSSARPGPTRASRSSPTRTSTAATSSARRANRGSRSTRNRSSASGSSTRPRSCATVAGSSGRPHPEARIRRRLDQLAAELDLDRERMRGWGIAHALAWDPDEDMLACARWLAAA